MVITGIMMTFAAARVDWVSMQVNSSARQVGTTLLAAQRLALLRQYAIVVAFDTVNSRLRIHEDRNNNTRIDSDEKTSYLHLEDGVTFGRGAAPTHPLVSTTVTYVRTQTGMPAVAFGRSGAASEMGGFYITSKRALGSAQRAKYDRAFSTVRATGRVSYFYYDGTEWRRGF
jgi:hypothetical protein